MRLPTSASWSQGSSTPCIFVFEGKRRFPLRAATGPEAACRWRWRLGVLVDCLGHFGQHRLHLAHRIGEVADFGRQLADVRSHLLHALLYDLQLFFVRRETLHRILFLIRQGLRRILRWTAATATLSPTSRTATTTAMTRSASACSRACACRHVGLSPATRSPASAMQLFTGVKYNISRPIPCTAVATRLSFQQGPLAMCRSPQLCCSHNAE